MVRVVVARRRSSSASLTSIVFATLVAAGFGLDVRFRRAALRAASLAVFTPEFGAAAVAVQVLAGGFGGYIAGRLRGRPRRYAHIDEAHFRDTAHGVVAWALGTVLAIVFTLGLLAPYADQIGPATTTQTVDAVRAANVAMQASLFTAIGMILSAFTAAVAARVGGLRNEEMHTKYSRCSGVTAGGRLLETLRLRATASARPTASPAARPSTTSAGRGRWGR